MNANSQTLTHLTRRVSRKTTLTAGERLRLAAVAKRLCATCTRMASAPFCDNETAVRVADEDYSTKRLKHVRTRMAFLKEAIKRRLVMLVHIDTAGNIALV
ncbi:hypothetical protein AB1Y20_020234 [Prymnesium parvum]|uniref:Uncharacterized protein n=1 Tax=Prymnesium parvum TaxID=97485 RepID=A0AB34JT21_PRYPA